MQYCCHIWSVDIRFSLSSLYRVQRRPRVLGNDAMSSTSTHRRNLSNKICLLFSNSQNLVAIGQSEHHCKEIFFLKSQCFERCSLRLSSGNFKMKPLEKDCCSFAVHCQIYIVCVFFFLFLFPLFFSNVKLLLVLFPLSLNLYCQVQEFKSLMTLTPNPRTLIVNFNWRALSVWGNPLQQVDCSCYTLYKLKN